MILGSIILTEYPQIFHVFELCFIYLFCMHQGECVSLCLSKGQRTTRLWKWLFSYLGLGGFNAGWWSGLTTSTLTSWVISPALLFLIACVPVWYVCVSAVIHVLWCGCGGQRMTTLNFLRQDFSFFLRHDILQINWFKSFWKMFLFLPSISPGISGVCFCSWHFMYQEFHSGSQDL